MNASPSENLDPSTDAPRDYAPLVLEYRRIENAGVPRRLLFAICTSIWGYVMIIGSFFGIFAQMIYPAEMREADRRAWFENEAQRRPVERVRRASGSQPMTLPIPLPRAPHPWTPWPMGFALFGMLATGFAVVGIGNTVLKRREPSRPRVRLVELSMLIFSIALLAFACICYGFEAWRIFMPVLICCGWIAVGAIGLAWWMRSTLPGEPQP